MALIIRRYKRAGEDVFCSHVWLLCTRWVTSEYRTSR
jgi:hypothetical protein